MTRINVGIHPTELCDQHLLAEIRELPRAFNHVTYKGPPNFTLGKGHVLWCARYRFSLYTRLLLLREEAYYRSFAITDWSTPLPDAFKSAWHITDESFARPLLIARIQERLITMVREPRWTHRTPPDWALPALEKRKK